MRFLLFLALFFGFLSCQNRAAEASQNQPQKLQTEGRSKSDEAQKPSKSSARGVPQNALETLDFVRKNGEAPAGFVGGRLFQNREKRLPKSDSAGKKIQYQEWDVREKERGQNRGAERLITGSDGSAFYTRDHYKTFIKIE